MMNLRTRFASILALTLSAACASAGPRVDVVIGAGAPPLEKFAAQELADQFALLFEAEVKVTDRLPAESPKKELLWPVLFVWPAMIPKKELLEPSVLEKPAPLPKNALCEPLLFSPMNTPAKVFEPGVLNTRLPPMLYCVVLLMVLPDNVPPAVPSPLILKLLLACWLVVF